jgi:shikimate kinase
MKIFLIGMPGAGKTTVGKKLASKLGLEFIDLDLFIEFKYQKRIHELFTAEGEAEFRKKEKYCLDEILSSKENYLLSLGGGTPCFFDNLERMNEAGISVYIEMPPAALAARITQGRGERPMFKGLSPDEILKKVNLLIGDREKFYSAASITVHGINLDVDDLAELLQLQKEKSDPGEKPE